MTCTVILIHTILNFNSNKNESINKTREYNIL